MRAATSLVASVNEFILALVGIEVPAATTFLPGNLTLAESPAGLVVFIHGNDSSQLSPRYSIDAGDVRSEASRRCYSIF